MITLKIPLNHVDMCLLSTFLYRKKGDSVENVLGSKVVKGLCEELYHTYRHIYYNYLSTVDLAPNLFRAGL